MPGDIIPFGESRKGKRDLATVIRNQNIAEASHFLDMEKTQYAAEIEASTAEWHKRLTQKIFRDDVEIYNEILAIADGDPALGRILAEHAQEYFKANARRIRNFGGGSKWL